MLAETSTNAPKPEAVIRKWKTSLQKQTLINETKSCFFEKINKIYIPLARLTKKARSLKLLKIRNKSTTNFTEIKGLVREYYEQSYANKLDNLDEMNKFLETHKLPRLKQKKKDSESVIKQNKLPTKNTQDHMVLLVKSSKYLKNQHQSFSNVFRKKNREHFLMPNKITRKKNKNYSISYEYRGKNSQQNTSKLNLAI